MCVNMKKLFLLLVTGFILQAGIICAQGYNIKVNIPHLSNKKVILANYFEGKVYSADTAQLDANGYGAFRNQTRNWPEECIYSSFLQVIILI